MDSILDAFRRRLPAQDLTRLTLAQAHPKKLQEWIASLPMVNVGESSRQVYQTVQELTRLNIDPETRFTLLEQLRPTVDYLCAALAKHYLNQPVVLPEKAAKVATLAQAMQTHLATGYKLVVVTLLPRLPRGGKRDPEAVKLATYAVHRAISDLTGTQLRCAQLYLGTPANLWRELHTLYLLADEYQLFDHACRDPHHKRVERSTVTDAYVRALLLATCNPNQLRQADIALVYQLTEVWAPLIQLRLVGTDSELFVFNLAGDAPPTYRTLAKLGEEHFVRAIAPEQLVARLHDIQVLLGADQKPQGPEARLSNELVRHLIHSWSELTQRTFNRVAHGGRLHLCVGLTASHYYVAGLKEFEAIMSGHQASAGHAGDSNPFTRKRSDKDPWALAFDAASASEDLHFGKGIDYHPAGSQPAEPVAAKAKYDNYVCAVVNMSPGGYCVQWQGEVPAAVRTGEILALREEDQDAWSIGAIRWIKQLPHVGAQLGLEILAPKAAPCGARVLKKTGESTEYMRTLMLPELKAIGRPATLITPNLTFRSGYKIQLNVGGGEEVKCQLTRQITSTPSFAQYEFTVIKGAETLAQLSDNDSGDSGEVNNDDDFDSIWSSL